jgi:translation initiation factor 1
VTERKNIVLFLGIETAAESRLAANLFVGEAQKLDLNWTASSSIADLQNADLVIVLQRGADADLIPELSSLKPDLWQLGQDADQVILQNVKNLVVRLILKAGKRPPMQQTSTHSSGQVVANSPTSKSVIRVSLDKKARRGKKVTVVSGLPLAEEALLNLAAGLKQICGSGGTVKDGQIEIQGDHRDRIMADLQNRGYKPKRSGG